MKASEEISADLFIKNCVKTGIEQHRKIVDHAKEEKSSEFASNVDELIREGESNVYSRVINQRRCSEHNVDMMYDQSKEEHYCPICL
jgi:hypothetical protein